VMWISEKRFGGSIVGEGMANERRKTGGARQTNCTTLKQDPFTEIAETSINYVLTQFETSTHVPSASPFILDNSYHLSSSSTRTQCEQLNEKNASIEQRNLG
jgi:hypothetical protein